MGTSIGAQILVKIFPGQMKSHLLGTVIMETMIADIHGMQTSKERVMKISFTE